MTFEILQKCKRVLAGFLHDAYGGKINAVVNTCLLLFSLTLTFRESHKKFKKMHFRGHNWLRLENGKADSIFLHSGNIINIIHLNIVRLGLNF